MAIEPKMVSRGQLLRVAVVLVWRMLRAAVHMGWQLTRADLRVGDMAKVEYRCDLDFTDADLYWPRVRED